MVRNLIYPKFLPSIIILKAMEDKKASGFIEQAHTADLALKVWAPDYFGLLCEAARGMYALIGIELAVLPVCSKEITITGEDEESLLVAYLTELLFLCEHDGLAFNPFDFTLDCRSLRVSLTGFPILRLAKEIKAVTFHHLAIMHHGGQLETTIVFDV